MILVMTACKMTLSLEEFYFFNLQIFLNTLPACEQVEQVKEILEKISGNEKIWYATNYEIYRYMMAQRAVLISTDEKCFYNPTAIDVWVEKDKKQIIHIPAGQTVVIE